MANASPPLSKAFVSRMSGSIEDYEGLRLSVRTSSVGAVKVSKSVSPFQLCVMVAVGLIV